MTHRQDLLRMLVDAGISYETEQHESVLTVLVPSTVGGGASEFAFDGDGRLVGVRVTDG